MTTTGQHFTVWQGEDKTITVTLTNSSGAAYGSTAGLVFTWKVSTSESSSTALITKTSGSGITNGTSAITIILDEGDTDDLTPGSYYHELRVVDGSSEHDVVLTGGLTLRKSLTVTV